jgi:uncharacterized membrane protein
MQASHQGKQRFWLSADQKKWLRPFYGDLVDKVAVTYNARLMDYLGSVGGRSLKGESAAQTYGYDIYVDDAYDPRSIEQVILLGHELHHAKQYVQYGSSLSNFGYHYFKSWARNGYDYARNGLEEAAAQEELTIRDKLLGLHVRNQTTIDVWVATASFDDTTRSWTSSGWWKLGPGEIKQVAWPPSAMDASSYYFYANSTTDAVWEGDTVSFWVHPGDKFGDVPQDLSPSTAASLGYEKRSFRELDVNQLTPGQFPRQLDLTLATTSTQPAQPPTSSTPFVPVSDPVHEAAAQVGAAARAGDIQQAIQLVGEAESVMALTLPGRTFAEVCWLGALNGEADQVLPLCDEAVRRLPNDPDARDKRGLARALTGDTSGAAEDFAFFVQKLDPLVSPQSKSEAAERLRIRKIWILQLIDGQFPFDASVLDDLRKVEREAPWISDENGQLTYASGSARPRTVVYETPSATTKPQEPATGGAQPGGGTGSSTQPAPPAPTVAVATTITDFEKWSAWRRGDEAWGTFGQSGEQHRSGKSAGKLSYDFPAGEADNYVVFLRTLPIAGQPDALRAQVYGDGSTHFLNAWVEDATGQAWQYTFGRINHTGWQEMVAPLDLSLGWPNQAVGDTTSTAPAFPIKLSALVLDGYSSDQAFTGDVYVDDLEAITYQGTDEAGSTQTGAVAAPTQERATITPATLNVRGGPGTSYGVVAKVRRGETYPVLGRDVATGWVQIAVPAAPSGAGWVSSQYVTISTTGASTQPVATGGPSTASPPGAAAPSQPAASPATGSAVPASPTPPASPGAGQASLVTDFESFGAWQRGDEAWGTFTQSAEQKQSGQYAGKFGFDFPNGEANNYVVFRRTIPIKGQPAALRMQVLGDGSTHFLNTWVQDAKGQLWQFSFGRINHQGWQAMEAPLDPSLGWPNQAIGHSATSIAYPIKLYALVLDGYTSDQAFTGSIYVDDLEAISQ